MRAALVKQLSPNDWREYSQLRLAALQECPSLYGSSVEKEAGYDEPEWRAWPSSERSALFGLYVDNCQVGQAGIMQDMDNHDSAFLMAAYILPDYRGMKLAVPLYQARLDWACQQGYWKNARIGHRDGNHAVRALAVKLGFSELVRKPHQWPDGQTADLVLYSRAL